MDLKEILSKLGVNTSDEIYNDFINFTYKKHWDDYNTHIMDLETIVRNKIGRASCRERVYGLV